MPEDARFLVSSALDYAERRGGRLRALTIGGGNASLLRQVERELSLCGLSDVEIHFEPNGDTLRLVAVEVDSAH